MEEMARLFVGLPLSEEARSSLWAFAQTLTDCRPLRRDMYHITLCFLGMRPRRDMERIARTVSAVDRPPLTLTLGGAGSFKKGDILWSGLQDPPEALFSFEELMNAISTGSPVPLSESVMCSDGRPEALTI